MLSKLQIEQYENDGYVVPDFKMPEDILNKIEERHDELLKKHPEFKNYCPAILHYDESFLEFCKNEIILNYVEQILGSDLLYGIQVFSLSLQSTVMQLHGIKTDNIGP